MQNFTPYLITNSTEPATYPIGHVIAARVVETTNGCYYEDVSGIILSSDFIQMIPFDAETIETAIENELYAEVTTSLPYQTEIVNVYGVEISDTGMVWVFAERQHAPSTEYSLAEIIGWVE